jgi:ubiquinol-cytochrome c reductase cytochrome c subunit
MKFQLRFTLLAAAFALVSLFPARSRAADDQAVEHGRQLFMANNCYLCHGTVGQGGAGPRIAPSQLGESALSAYVRHPTGRMPPFTTVVLRDADLAAIYAYLQSVPGAPDPLPELLSRSPGAGSK